MKKLNYNLKAKKRRKRIAKGILWGLVAIGLVMASMRF